MEIVFPIAILLFLSFFVFLAFTKKGKGLFFGGAIIKTIGEKIGSKRGIISANVRVHVVKTKLPQPNTFQVGLELSQTSVASFQMTPITLSQREAGLLITMLQEAIEYDEKT